MDELKAFGEKITLKYWKAEAACLSAHNDILYQQMKAMRADIQTVEKIRRTTNELARSEKPGEREREPKL